MTELSKKRWGATEAGEEVALYTVRNLHGLKRPLRRTAAGW